MNAHTTQRVDEALAELIFPRNLAPALLGVPYGAFLLVLAWPIFPHSSLLGWFLLKLLTGALRIGVHLGWLWSDKSPRVWVSRFTVALGLDGLCWSLLGVAFATSDYPRLMAVMLSTVIAVAAVGGVVLSSNLRALVVFCSATLLPAALYHLTTSDSMELVAGVGMVFFLVLMIDFGRRSSADTLELLRLRYDLADARDVALAADRAKAEFLATMSHELRTPLNAVIGTASLLERDALPKSTLERVSTIRTSAEGLLHIIGNILDFSKVEAGNERSVPTPVHLRDLIEHSLDQVAVEARRKGLELSYELAEGCSVGMLTDRPRLGQILLNLLSNAVKFTQEGSVSLKAVPTEMASGEPALQISVADTGIGIPLAFRTAIFDAFSQGQSGITRQFGGTGLGLAISLRFAELLGGHLSVDSDTGGSTFQLSIPMVSTDVVEPSLDGRRFGLIFDRQERATAIGNHLESLGASVMIGDADLDEQTIVLVEQGSEEARASTLEALSRRGLPTVVLGHERGSLPASVGFLHQPFLFMHLFPLLDGTVDAGETRPDLGLNVLIVDDTVTNQTIAAAMVRFLGCHAEVVSSGSEALERLRGGKRFDVVLMDVQMADMDGLETTRRILAAGGEVPVIIGLTADALAGDRERGLQAGMTDYLCKPVTLDELGTVLTQIRLA